jgi:hypothetical protein
MSAFRLARLTPFSTFQQAGSCQPPLHDGVAQPLRRPSNPHEV